MYKIIKKIKTSPFIFNIIYSTPFYQTLHKNIEKKLILTSVSILKFLQNFK